MGSMGNPSDTNWPPYNAGYRDCSQGICSIYCPQWCYLIFPPPPSFQSNDDDSGMNFSPLIIVVIGILASAFLLVSYYTIISKYCKRRANQLNPILEPENRTQSTTRDRLQHAATGLDESLIKSITVCQYVKGDGVVEGSDCAVCLSEFEEGESLRLLPKCNHAFHLPCIDTWLKSHSNCPLCRSHIMPGIPIPFQRPLESHITSSNFNVNSVVFQRRNDLVLVMEEAQQRGDHGDHDHIVVGVVTDENRQRFRFHDLEYDVNGTRFMGVGDGQEVRRSMSCQNPNVLIGDILRDEEDYYEDVHHHAQAVGPSKGENSKSTKISSSMKRSVSTGRFTFTRNIEKGRNSILPN